MPAYLTGFEPMMGIELMTSSLPRMRSAPELHRQKYRAGQENRTPISSLEGWHNSHYTNPAFEMFSIHFRRYCGQGWTRTTEGENQQIYSLPHLATLVLAHIFLKNAAEPMGGVEPSTSRLQITRSSQLSYIGRFFVFQRPLREGIAKIRTFS